jgi:hypothetical protein
VVLLDRLARYQPTRVAIEATYGRSPWLARYRDYLASNYQLGKNEIELVGFQLARRGIDEMGQQAHAYGVRNRLGENQQRDGDETAHVDAKVMKQRFVERVAEDPAAFSTRPRPRSAAK